MKECSERQSRHRRYRSSGKQRTRNDDALHEALNLLADNDAASMARVHAPSLSERVRGKFTWATVAEWVAGELGSRIVERGAPHAETVDDAKELMVRLDQRDATRSVRVTAALRDKILLVHTTAVTIDELERVSDGNLVANYETAGRASSLLMRWLRLGGSKDGWARTLMEDATAKVLTSSASAGVKAFYTRSLAVWLPKPSELQLPVGESIEWSDTE